MTDKDDEKPEFPDDFGFSASMTLTGTPVNGVKSGFSTSPSTQMSSIGAASASFLPIAGRPRIISMVRYRLGMS